MEEDRAPGVVAADRLDGSVIVTFDDGRCGVFSAALLYAMLAHADKVTDEAEPRKRAEVVAVRAR